MRNLLSLFPAAVLGFSAVAVLALPAQADTPIPSGTTSTSDVVTAVDNYVLSLGSVLNYTGTAQAFSANEKGSTFIDIEGQLTSSNNGKGLVLANTPVSITDVYSYLVSVGQSGSIQTTDATAISFKRSGNATNTGVLALSVNNQGSIVVNETDTIGTGNSLAIDTKGNTTGLVTDPAAANYFTAGGVITNGSVTNSTALIQSSSDVAIAMGSNQTLTNYGSIISNSIINDSSKNNSMNGGSTNASYDIGRAVEMGLKGDTVNNYGTISGAQHGVDESSAATNLVVNNYGTIIGNNGSGIGSDTNDGRPINEIVTNYGTILAKNAGVGHIFDQSSNASVDSDPDAIDIDGGATIYNHGLVQSVDAATGFDTRGRANGSDGLALGGGNVFNYSDGRILSAQDAVTVNNDAVVGRSGGTALNLQNDGLIQASAGYAVRSENYPFSASDTSADDTLTNTGTIIGGTAAPDPTQVAHLESGAIDTFATGPLNGVTYNNNGTYTDSTGTHPGNARFVDGDGSAIQMGEGKDTLTNTGTITGLAGKAINMEGGDDTVNIGAGSVITGDIDGGNGGEIVGDTLNFDLGANGQSVSYAGSLSDFEHVHVIRGTTTLSGVSTYLGETRISGGRLVLSGAGRLSASSALILDGGALAFSNIGAAGGQEFASLSVTADSVLDLESTTTITFDLLSTLTAGADLAVLGYDPSISPNYAFRFVGDLTSDPNLQALENATTINGAAPIVSYDGTYTNFRTTAVPEPSTWAIALALLAFVGLRIRRSRVVRGS